MLESARKRVPIVTFLQQDLRDLGPTLGQFDAIVSFFRGLDAVPVRYPDGAAGDTRPAPGARTLTLGMLAGDFDSVSITFLGVPMQGSAFPSEELAAEIDAAGFDVTQVREVPVRMDSGDTETEIFARAIAR
jgi:hypothetical protein